MVATYCWATYRYVLWKGVLPLDVSAGLLYGDDNGDEFQPEVEADVSVSQGWLPNSMDAGRSEPCFFYENQAEC